MHWFRASCCCDIGSLIPLDLWICDFSIKGIIYLLTEPKNIKWCFEVNKTFVRHCTSHIVKLLSIKTCILTHKYSNGNVEIVEFALIKSFHAFAYINLDLFVSLDAVIVIVNKQSSTTYTSVHKICECIVNSIHTYIWMRNEV